MKISQCFDALTITGKSLSWRSAIAALLLVTLSCDRRTVIPGSGAE